MNKCPICGAPMENNSCTYCNYENELSQTKSKDETVVVINNVVNHIEPGYSLFIESTVSNKSKMVSLLCIFLGYFGAHQFYVGNTKKGILYFLTFGLFGIGWLIDIILILLGSFKDVHGLPVKS